MPFRRPILKKGSWGGYGDWNKMKGRFFTPIHASKPFFCGNGEPMLIDLKGSRIKERLF